MDSLIVCNKRRVSDFLGFNIGDEDIINTKKCKDFINKYQKFFEDVSISSFKEFYRKTGLKLSIIYIKDLCNQVSFNELGSSIDTIFNNTVYNHDLLVIHKANLIEIDNEIIKINGKVKYAINSNIDAVINENKYKEIRYELSNAKSINDKKKIIKDMYEKKYSFSDGVKQIYLSSFGNLFVLYDNGILYQENEIYARNVLTIWEANSYVCFLIFKDYSLEYLSNSYECYHNEKCDNIIYNDNYIAFKRDKELEIISLLEENDSNFHAYFSNVDDISYGNNEMEIALKTNGNEIYYRVTGFIEKTNKERKVRKFIPY